MIKDTSVLQGAALQSIPTPESIALMLQITVGIEVQRLMDKASQGVPLNITQTKQLEAYQKIITSLQAEVRQQEKHDHDIESLPTAEISQLFIEAVKAKEEEQKLIGVTNGHKPKSS